MCAFIGTYGGLSFLIYKYYLNIDGRIYACNYENKLKTKKIDFRKFCFNSKLQYIMPLSILESILLEDDTTSHARIKYPQLMDECQYVCLRNSAVDNNIIINKGGGFFHFYIEVIPLLLQYIDNGYNVYFIIENKSFYESILSFYKITYDRNCTYPNHNGHILEMPRYYPAIDNVLKIRQYNHDFYQIEGNTFRRIYITRRNERARRIYNEQNLISQLQLLGFEILDPGTLDYRDQIKCFINAQIIVAAHGAALSNIVWCNKDVKIIELNSDKDVRWHFAKIALLLNFKYKLILGETLDDVYFTVDVPLIERAITEIML